MDLLGLALKLNATDDVARLKCTMHAAALVYVCGPAKCSFPCNPVLRKNLTLAIGYDVGLTRSITESETGTGSTY